MDRARTPMPAGWLDTPVTFEPIDHHVYRLFRDDGLDGFYSGTTGTLYQRELFAHAQRFVEFLAPQTCAWIQCHRRATLGIAADLRRRRFLPPPVTTPPTFDDGSPRVPSSPAEWYTNTVPFGTGVNRRPPQDALPWTPVGPDTPRWTALPLCDRHAHAKQVYLKPYSTKTIVWRAVLTHSLLDELRAEATRLAQDAVTAAQLLDEWACHYYTGTYLLLTAGGIRQLDITTRRTSPYPQCMRYPGLLRLTHTICARHAAPTADDIASRNALTRHASPYDFLLDDKLLVCSIDACDGYVTSGRGGYYYCTVHAALHDDGAYDQSDETRHARVLALEHDQPEHDQPEHKPQEGAP